MKKVILTGGTGFIGANLARRLLSDGQEVHLLVRAGHSPWRIEAIRSDLHLHEVEMVDAVAVLRLFEQVRPDWIFHLAAHGAYSWQNDLSQITATNIIGLQNLVEAGLKTGFEAFINTGSSSEYGYQDHAPAETELVEPNSYYAWAKASATLYCRYIAQSRQVNLTTLRSYSAFGPYEEPNRLLPTLIAHGLEGRLPSLVNPDISRDFIEVGDVCEAFILAATKPAATPGAVYNIGSGVGISLREAVAAARRELSIEVEPVWGTMPNRAWDTSVWVADNRRAKAELGWQPRYDFAEGFRQMIAWFKANPAILAYYRQRIFQKS